jgi:hypothetical protein
MNYQDGTKAVIVPRIEEIVRAHDILETITHDIEVKIPEDTKLAMIASLDVLCWILGHERGNDFIENLIMTEAELATQGLIFVEKKEEGE